MLTNLRNRLQESYMVISCKKINQVVFSFLKVARVIQISLDNESVTFSLW